MLTIYLPYITLTDATGKDSNGISSYQVKVQPPVEFGKNHRLCLGRAILLILIKFIDCRRAHMWINGPLLSVGLALLRHLRPS